MPRCTHATVETALTGRCMVEALAGVCTCEAGLQGTTFLECNTDAVKVTILRIASPVDFRISDPDNFRGT